MIILLIIRGVKQNYNKWNLWLNGDVKHFIFVNLKFFF